ncbi:MAG: molybdopterin-dependent oxidoreductase, partial [Methanosarcinales archaeon]
RGSLILEHLYHPDRVNYPLKRIGERGEGKWQRITWDEAMDEIAKKLREIKEKYGPEALAFSHGTNRTCHWPGRRFYNIFGSPNMHGANQICMCPTHSVEWSTYGFMAYGDLHNTSCIVVWGHAPSESQPIQEWKGIVQAKNRGAKLIVVDPRSTKEAELADLWLQVRPGTDLALMLCWMKVIIEENLYDKEFVEKWTVGFDQLKEKVNKYTPEKVAEITWIPKEKIIEAARTYATLKPAVLTWGLGIDKQGVNAIQAARARCILRAITGNLDEKGGELLGYSGEIGKIVSDLYMELNQSLSANQREKQLGANEYKLMSYIGWELIYDAASKLPATYIKPPVADMTCVAHSREVWNAILTEKPYPVKAMITLANNPLLQAANTKLVYKALKKLDLLVVMDYFMTPTAELSDYILPAANSLERSDLQNTPNFCIPCPKAMEPLYERKDDYYFWRELAVRLGQEEHWPWNNIEEACNYRLKPLGLSFKDLVDRYGILGTPEYQKYEKYGFGTPSGKVELYSSIFEKLGYDPLPEYREPPESPIQSPELAKQYPLILITGGRFMPMYHSEMRQIPSARKLHPDPLTDIHPETASRLGISEGDWVWIETPRGRIKQRARLSEKVHPATVHVQHGWWFPEMHFWEPSLHGLWESNANILCPDDPEYCNPEVGGWPHTALLCKVYKV